MDAEMTVPILNCVLNIPTCVTATVGNFLVLVSIWKTPSLHKPSHVLLFSLALSDLGVGLVVQPIFVFHSVVWIKDLEDLTRRSYLALRIAGYYLSGVSLLTLTSISLDKYIAIRFHLRYKEIVTVKRMVAILLVIWLATIASATSSLWCDCKSVLYLKSAGILACFLVTVVFYFWIYRVVRRHQAHINANLPEQVENSARISQFKKSSWNMVLVYLVFIFCYLPYLIVKLMITVTGQSVLKQSLYNVFSTIVLINSSLNPILYCWRIGEVRSAVQKTVRSFRQGFCGTKK